MACKPSGNLVLLRVHRVPSNQTQPVMLHSTEAGAPGQLLRQRPGTTTKKHNGGVGDGVTSHRTDHTSSIELRSNAHLGVTDTESGLKHL